MLPRELQEMEEKQRLSQYATPSDGPLSVRRYKQQPDDLRTEFYRDYTRILHSRAFRRLRHKTQVFLSPENDHISTRIEHALYVSSIARTLARAMKLNEDLTMAIAIGHDLGHAPFGHVGEEILSSIAREFGINNARFWHEEHALEVVDQLESPYEQYPGMNLTLAVRDGIACHYGEHFSRNLIPDRSKTYILQERKTDKPRTLEGCVVRAVDVISYLGRDLEDGLRVGLITEDEIPPDVVRVLGKRNRDIIHKLVQDLYGNYAGDDVLIFSDEISAAAKRLKKFNNERIYQSDLVTRRKQLVGKAIRDTFDELVAVAEYCEGEPERIRRQKKTAISEFDRKIFAGFVQDDFRPQIPADSGSIRLCALYFIAGMTDNYFLRIHQRMLRAEV